MTRSTQEIRVCSLQDSALDLEAMSEQIDPKTGQKRGLSVIEQYATTRDESLIVGREGEPITWFVIRRLDVRQAEHAMSASTDAERNRRAFMGAVVKISDLTTQDGSVVSEFRPSGTRHVDGLDVPVLTDADLACIALSYVQEIGGIAFARAFLAPKGALRYPLPPHFSLMLTSQVASLVARERDLARPGRALPAAAATPTPTAPPMDATVAPTIQTRDQAESASIDLAPPSER